MEKAKAKKLKIGASISVSAVFIIVLSAVFGVMGNGHLTSAHPFIRPKEGQLRVACVGDSITYGNGVKGWFKKSYPKQLQSLLGKAYCVNNFGYSARTAMSDADRPYINEKLYKKSLDFNPDIVVIMLGTNDSKNFNWKNKEVFKTQYGALLDTYAGLSSKPKIYVIAPPPVFPVNGKINYNMQPDIIDGDISDAIRELAEEKGFYLIDMNEAFRGKPELFSDGVHPNADGAKLFAETVYKAIKN